MQQEDIAVNDAPGGGRNEHRGVDISMVSRWEAFFQGTDYMQKIREVSDLYPEERSINVVYADLDHFDADLAIYLLEHPDLALLAGKQAIRNLMHAEMRRADINLRLISLPRDSKVEIRQLRAKHVGKLVCVEGLARKATEVRPKITDALFQCLRCGHVVKEVQEGLFFKEPMECYKEQDGCGRTPGTTKFKLLTDESRFVDTQKIEVQESPEGLRGGAQPERLTGYLEDDIAGAVSPGDRVILNGILRSVQKGQPAKSTLFDINLDVISAEFQQHEYDEISITEEDEEKIKEIAASPDLFEKIVASISPTIYGYNTEKESLALQLFSGVPKLLDDGTRIRGDIHILLVGDPGVAKCVTSDALVSLSDGTTRKMGDIVEGGLAAGEEVIDDGVTAPIDLPVITFSARGRMESGRAIRVWKRTAPKTMMRVRTSQGRTLTMTPTHPLFVQWVNRIMPREACNLKVGMSIVVYVGDSGEDDPYGWNLGFGYDIIESIEEIASEEEWVYDLEVEGSHNYIANGIMSHNSQMLRYMSRLAPRGIYASGKSSSAAGLCVSPDSLIIVDGKETPIGDFVEKNMSSPQEVRQGQWMEMLSGQYMISTMSDMCQTVRMATAIWRIKTPSFLVELVEKSGKRLTLTPETKVWCRPDASSEGWSKASDIRDGQSILVSDGAGGFRWSQVSSSRALETDLPPFVYDLTIDHAHSFLANGFVVHNTAAAVKDDFGEGRWTLEAGALVLADKGMACVEENQPVATTRGLVPIKDVRVGDTVLNYSDGPSYGIVKRVIQKGEKQTIRIRLYSGEVIECTPDHHILTGSGWREAGQLTKQDKVRIPADYSKPGLMDRERFEKGFLHGFALCDVYYDETSSKNSTGFSSGLKNEDRAAHVAELLRKNYGIEVGGELRNETTQVIRGQMVNFGPNVMHYFSSHSFKEEVRALFHHDHLPLDEDDYCIGFLAGVVSTDCCVAHKQGAYGVKHVVDIGVGRRKYGPGWTERKQRLLLALFHRFGIMAVKRGRKVQITSLDSYNRLVDLVGPHVVGKNKSKLYPVLATKHISACDTLLDDDYVDWFSSVKFNTPRTVELGLHSRIYRAAKGRKVTTTLMETLRPHWSSITDEPFKEPAKNYLLNPIMDIEEGGLRPVYDLTIDGEPNFLVSGGIVHNCVDEMDKMTDQDRSSMHEAMESQCYDDQTEVLTDHGWKLFKDVDDNDLVASLTDGKLSFVKPTQYVEADHHGDLYHVAAENVDLAVSPNHNMYVSLRNGNGGWSDFGLRRMDEIAEDSSMRLMRMNDAGGMETFEVGPESITRVRYSNKIYCVEVPDHVIYVRRNGKPVWCGNTISVAKAGITATLQCRCSLLGAANPKYGRFEQNQYIADQINMPPALLSRFDLIFALTDKPSADRDANITAHILKTHRRGQLMKYEDPSILEGVDVEGIMGDSKTVEPVLDREFFRKYVAFAKRFSPVLSDDAMKLISDFYLKIRKQGEGEGASVPITARQLEAFVRLSEASARARLSNIATVEDAQRAVRIVEYYLRKIAGEGDRLDFDIIATGTSHSQREQITILKDLIGSLLRSGEGVDAKRGVGSDVLFKAAADRGITEDRAKTLLRRLSQNGEIYSPSGGFYKLTSEG